jgi:hypothetical protein
VEEAVSVFERQTGAKTGGGLAARESRESGARSRTRQHAKRAGEAHDPD